MRNPQIFYFSASLSRLKCNEISEEIPCQERKNTPNIPVGRRFCALEVTDPGASGRGGREATYDGHSFGRIYGPILDRLPWSVRKILRHLVNIGRGGPPLRRPAARLQVLIPLR